MKIRNKQNSSSVRRPAYTTWAFTLVELIVVITILAILGTIAFISLQGYSSQARDSKRLSDISNIKKSVELFSLNTGKYPEPDDSITMSYSGEVLRYQGTVGAQVTTNVSRNLNEKPLDPSTGLEYIYSTTHSQTEYEVLGLYESDLLGTSPLFFAKATKSRQPSPLRGEGARTLFFSSTNAETQDYPKIDGNYNGIYIKTSSFYVPTPSIINAEIVSNDDLDDNLIKSQIITGGDNLPLTNTGGLNVKFSYYEGIITSDSTDTAKMTLVEAIQSAYSGSDLASDTMYADLLSRTGTGELVDFVDVVVLKNSINSSSFTLNCSTQPEYSNANFIIGTPTEVNQEWQNTDSEIACYYECIPGYTGKNCSYSGVTDINGDPLEIDYYVSVNGLDSNDGSFDNPFETFLNIPAGSVVGILPGHFTGMFFAGDYHAVPKIFTSLREKNNMKIIGLGDVVIDITNTSKRDEHAISGTDNSFVKNITFHSYLTSSTNYNVSLARGTNKLDFKDVIFIIENYYSLNYCNGCSLDDKVEYYQCTFNGGTKLSNYSGYSSVYP